MCFSLYLFKMYVINFYWNIRLYKVDKVVHDTTRNNVPTYCDFSYSSVSNQDVKNSTMFVYFISKVYRNFDLVLLSAQELRWKVFLVILNIEHYTDIKFKREFTCL